MNSNYSGNYYQGMVDVNISESTASSSLERAVKLLASFPSGVQKATESALARAGKSGQAIAAREVGKQYHLKTSDFKKYTKSNQRVNRTGNEISVSLSFRGFHVPLIRFKTSVTSSGLIRSQVMRNSTAGVLRHVFQQEMESGHIGLFERTGVHKINSKGKYAGKRRETIEQLYGPSVPQMMGANTQLADAVGSNIERVFTERMEHEITAILNGWRR